MTSKTEEKTSNEEKTSSEPKIDLDEFIRIKQLKPWHRVLLADQSEPGERHTVRGWSVIFTNVLKRPA